MEDFISLAHTTEDDTSSKLSSNHKLSNGYMKPHEVCGARACVCVCVCVCARARLSSVE